MPTTLILGAGPTGLSAAYHLGQDSLLIDRNDRVGGWCRSIEDSGFTFDHAGHILFSDDRYVHELYRILLGDNVHWQDREAWIYSKGVYTRYPFQGSLHGLPPEVIRDCLTGAIEARFGRIRKDERGLEATMADGRARKARAEMRKTLDPVSTFRDGVHCDPRGALDCCGDGVLDDAAAGGGWTEDVLDRAPRNFEEFIYRVWGWGIAKHFAIPYNRKLWTIPLDEMETSWLGGRVPLPDLVEIIEGALAPSPKPMGPNARFGYPLRGGFQALMDGFLPHLRGDLRLGARAVRVSPRDRTVTLEDGSTIGYRYLVSTIPLPSLVALAGEEAPFFVREAAGGLRSVSVRCVNLGVGREKVTDKHWIYFPENTVFHRIFAQGNASPHASPPGGFGLTCEITYSPTKPLPCEGKDLIRLCIEDCRRVGILRPDDPILAANEIDMPGAYVIYDHGRMKNVATVRGWFDSQDIILAGRYAEWKYFNSDHAFLSGKRAAEAVRDRLAAPAEAALV
jgi:UDP-galactopyranose mutase